MKTQNTENVEMFFQNISSNRKSAFTLVELIIVITILAILATIGFMSYQSYTSDARDANRTTSLQEIGKGLDIYSIKSSRLPSPENPVTITASGVTIGYQGTFGDALSSTIKMTSTPLDPKDNTKYIYAINESKTKYQLLTYLENQTSYNSNITNQAYAIDYTTRKFKTFGDKLGIILNSDNSPISTNVETQTGTTNYNLVFSDTASYTLSGNLLSVIQAFRGDKSLASLDNSLVGYWDMETTTLSGTTTVLKDLSQYGNNGTCYNSGTAVNCGTSGLGPQIVDGNGTTGKAMQFDGVDDWINMGNNSSLNPVNKITLLNLYKHIGTPYGALRFGCQVSKWNGNGYEITRHKDTNNSYFIFKNNSDNIYSAGNISDIVSISEFQLNSGVFDGNTIKFYLNGSLRSYGTATGNILNATSIPLRIGTNTGDGFANGYIDEVKIYNQALSDSAIKAIYDATK